MTRQSSTDPREQDKHTNLQAERLLAELLAELVGMGNAPVSDPADLYRSALSSFVDALLSTATARGNPSATAGLGPVAMSPLREMGPLTPERVGRVYEYLRGFRLELKRGTAPQLVPSVKGKRNQGLFYTPPRIVNHIVKVTLDRLQIDDPWDYQDLRILDPAMGTGIFLAEALELVLERVLNGIRHARPKKINRMVEHLQHRVEREGLEITVDQETALRVHILENCLYGVDLDPIAARIARAVLVKRAFREFPPLRDSIVHTRIGNALVGVGKGDHGFLFEAANDEEHARAYFGKRLPDGIDITRWAASHAVFHWPLEFPAIFADGRHGFDAVVGNPPYEIVSVKESGVAERRREQQYYRKIYKACQGKINTYRLMLERGLDLLREGGVLGFIVPATLLADSTAEKLRRTILDESSVQQAIVIPERAGVFEGVTQALLILVTRKGAKTDVVDPVFWNGNGPIPSQAGIQISRELIDRAGSRIPLLRSSAERKLFEALTPHPTLSGNEVFSPIAYVHQGEINLTVHREFITSEQTAFPLIRGEHVFPFNVVHPSSRGPRLDWVRPDFLLREEKSDRSGRGSLSVSPSGGSGGRGKPWKRKRIVLGRVVNMQTHRRLKASAVPSNSFLGDMTNSVTPIGVPLNYLLGLLNSRLLNWRIKVTSTNNYLSAREIQDLPIPRTIASPPAPEVVEPAWQDIRSILEQPPGSIAACLEKIRLEVPSLAEEHSTALLQAMIEKVVEEILGHPCVKPGCARPDLLGLLDALVLTLYGADSWAELLDG